MYEYARGMNKFSIAYSSRNRPADGERVIMTYHYSWLPGVMKIRVWIKDMEYDFWTREGTYWGRNGELGWGNFWLPTLETKMQSLIQNYDTDAVAAETMAAFDFIAKQKKEIEEIVRLELGD